MPRPASDNARTYDPLGDLVVATPTACEVCGVGGATGSIPCCPKHRRMLAEGHDRKWLAQLHRQMRQGLYSGGRPSEPQASTYFSQNQPKKEAAAMSYRCEVCGKPSRPKAARLLHVVERTVQTPTGPRTEVDREVPVCQSCKDYLDAGLDLGDLIAEFAEVRDLTLRGKTSQ